MGVIFWSILERLLQESPLGLLLDSGSESSLGSRDSRGIYQSSSVMTVLCDKHLRPLGFLCKLVRVISSFPLKECFPILGLGFHNSL